MPTMFDPTVVPNPFQPIVPLRGPGASLPVALHRQRARRAEMLAATRRLLAQGADGFTLKRVAEECEVTVQTLRNSFGRRDDLLVSALNEHTGAIWQALASVSAGPLLFLDLAQIYYHCAVATPGFLREMVRTAMSSGRPLALLQRHGAMIKIAHLRAMARRDLLAPGVAIDGLAAQITRLNTFMMYEWAMGGDAEDLRDQMLAGNLLLLRGALRPSGAAELEARMAP